MCAFFTLRTPVAGPARVYICCTLLLWCKYAKATGREMMLGGSNYFRGRRGDDNDNDEDGDDDDDDDGDGR